MLEMHIVKRYADFTLDVDFATEASIAALIGPSGSGKTQTVRAVAGAMRPDRGRIAIDCEVLFDTAHGVDRPPQERRVGYVPQHYALFPHLDVLRNVAYGLGKKSRSEARDVATAMLATVGLAGLERRSPRELSGGQQQRVALARALVTAPRLLLLDEPFAALDAPIRATLRQQLADLQRRLGFRALLVTHDPDDLALAEEHFVFDQGRVTTAVQSL